MPNTRERLKARVMTQEERHALAEQKFGKKIADYNYGQDIPDFERKADGGLAIGDVVSEPERVKPIDPKTRQQVIDIISDEEKTVPEIIDELNADEETKQVIKDVTNTFIQIVRDVGTGIRNVMGMHKS